MRSFANNPRLDKHEKPKSASVKKKIPSRFWKPEISFLKRVIISSRIRIQELT
jgi:hypothetical protein